MKNNHGKGIGKLCSLVPKQSRSGQGLVEYLILVCLLAVSAIAVVSVVGKNVREQYANISAALRNDKRVKVTAADPQTYGIRGMDNFSESSRTME